MKYVKSMLNSMKAFIRDEDGMGTVEVIFLICALIALAAIFKKALVPKIEAWVGSIGKGNILDPTEQNK